MQPLLNTFFDSVFGGLKVIEGSPTYVPKNLSEQLILGTTDGNVDTVAQATIAGPNEITLSELDVVWPFNITGQAVTSTSTGTMPGGVTSGTTYYIIRVSNGLCKFAATFADAIAGTPVISITSSGTGVWTISATASPPQVMTLFVYDTVANVWKYNQLS